MRSNLPPLSLSGALSAATGGGDPAAGEPRDAGSLVELTEGQLFASAQPRTIVSVLGSGVCVCLYDDTTGIGGVCHFVQPVAGAHPTDPLLYGSTAIRALLDRLVRLGAKRHYLAAKIVGGALIGDGVRESRFNSGAANVALAQSVMYEERILVTLEDVGGTRGRKLQFATGDGTAWVRVL
jgi:chemotaxis protein CheD